MGWTRFLTVKLPLIICWLSCTLYAGFANALSLAPITVRSYLGQNLIAEIDILSLTPQEEASLKAIVAAPKVFVDLNMDFSQSIGDAQIELLRRPNGTRFIKLRSARPIAEPFVDLVIEVSASTAKLVRPYRLLLDPPPVDDGAIAAPELAQRSEAANSAPVTTAPVSEPLPLPAAGAAKPLGAKNTKRNEAATEKSPYEEQIVKVAPGDTAGKIANRLKPEGASTEQMLIALLQSNPQAFIRGNVNLIQSGASVAVPPAETIYQVDAKAARAAIAAQAHAFNTLQRAGKKQIYPAKGTEYSSVDAKAPGTLESKNPVEKGKDALKLSKSTTQDKKEVEKLEQLAREKNKQSELDRAAELAKNIQELNALAKASAAPTAGTSASTPLASASEPSVGVLPAAPMLPAPAAQDAASANPVLPASRAVIPNAPTNGASSPPPVEPELLDVAIETLADSLGIFLVALGAMGAGVGAIMWARKRKGKRQALAPVAVADKNEAPWSTNTEVNNNAYGGDQVDTSLSNSRLPAENTVFAAELDPVAEADVYLAYGKDEPAEEILREGLLQDPKRVAIHLKLAEIYAARQDVTNFAICADQVEALGGTGGADWAQIKSLGQSMEPANPRYQDTVTASTSSNAKANMLEFEDSLFAGKPAANGTTAKSPLNQSAKDPVLSFAPGGAAAPGSAKTKPPSPMAFDMDALSLDLGTNPAPQTQSMTEQLETSMELAKQFIEIGEMQGARSMLDEVIANGSDEQRKRAQSMMAKLK